MSSNPMRDLMRHAIEQGWTVEKARAGHLKWITPDGQLVVSGSTPSEYRGHRNLRAHLRRAGLRLPRKDGRMR